MVDKLLSFDKKFCIFRGQTEMLASIYLLTSIGATANAGYTPMPPPVVRTVSVPPPMTVVPTIPIFPGPPKGKESSPIPKVNPGGWASTFDYPPLALREEREGTTTFTLNINKDGRVSDCMITTSSGHADLDQVTCSSVTRRAIFYPAQDKKGAPTTGKYSNRVRWQIPSIATMASLPLQNNSYPRSAQIRNTASLRVAREDYPPAALSALQEGSATFSLDIDNQGAVRNCSIIKTSGIPVLDDQSCAVARKWEFDPARDIEGRPVAARTSHNIAWRLPKGAMGASPAIQRPLRNPFDKVGAMTMTLDFDKEGKLSDCALEHKGETGIFGSPPNLSEDLCKGAPGRGDVQPFVGSDGNPQPRRVIVKISVEHAEVPAKPAEKPTEQ